MEDLFNWAAFHRVQAELSDAEKVLIRKMFRIYIEGNPSMENESEPSSAEREHQYTIFETAWIMRSMWTRNE